MEKIAVIGGGAAGLMAAGRLAERGKNVVLIEKNPMLGKKIRITGKGRCNVTNACDVEDILKNVPVNANFLYSALYTFTNDNLIELLKNHGVLTKVERGGRVFPVSDSAKDVVEALKKYALKPNVHLLKKEVSSLIIEDNKIKGLKYKTGEKLYVDKVIVATGGKSYPLTGSTGDGYAFARAAGHTVTDIKPSLVPIEIHQRFCRELMGLSLKNVAVKAKNENGKAVFEDFGEMLFTHFGVSGPVILSLSSHIKNPETTKYTISIDLKPALDEKQLDLRILRDFEKFKNKQFINSLDELLPKKLIPIVIRLSGIDERKCVNQISKDERKRFLNVLKNFTLDVKGFRPIDEAIVTSGGVCVKEINSSTMESKIVQGLYFAGEVIDVDAYTGGFNLQIAFSTGYLAGDKA